MVPKLLRGLITRPVCRVTLHSSHPPLLSSTFIIHALHSHSDFLHSPFHHTWLLYSTVLPSQFPLQCATLNNLLLALTAQTCENKLTAKNQSLIGVSVFSFCLHKYFVGFPFWRFFFYYHCWSGSFQRDQTVFLLHTACMFMLTVTTLKWSVCCLQM